MSIAPIYLFVKYAWLGATLEVEMTVESGQGKQPRSLPSFQIIFGTIIALIGGGGKFVSARLMDEQSHIPVTIGDVHLQLNQFEVNWVSNAIIVIGALFVFTATRRG